MCNVLDVPETFLMKICIVSSASEAEELRLEMLDERRMMCDCCEDVWFQRLWWLSVRMARLRSGRVERWMTTVSVVAVAALD